MMTGLELFFLFLRCVDAITQPSFLDRHIFAASRSDKGIFLTLQKIEIYWWAKLTFARDPGKYGQILD